MGVAGGGEDLEDFVFDGEDGDVEGTSTKVVDEDFGFTIGRGLLVQPVGNGGCSRFVEDPYDVEAGDGACVFRRLPLGIVEVCRAGQFTVVRKRPLAETYMRGQ